MTTTDLQLKRPAQIVERPTGPVAPPPMPAPDPFHARASAFVLVGALAAAGVGANVHPDYMADANYAIGGVMTAIFLFIGCVGRYSTPPAKP